MAKKKSKSAQDSVQAKARQMREAQDRADRQTRNVIIGVVAVVILAIVATLVFVVKEQTKTVTTESGNAGTALPEQYANGEPIVISHLGVGQKDEDLQDLEMYFSFSCSWCAYLQDSVGPELEKSATNGDYNLVLQPVNTAYAPFQGPATAAALWVAAEAPDQFLAFNQALAEFFFDAVQTGDKDIIMDLDASQQKVNDIAARANVPQEVIEKFVSDASGYLSASTAKWTEREVDGREGGTGTPELIFKDSKVPWAQGTPEEIMASITAGLDSLGYQPGQK